MLKVFFENDHIRTFFESDIIRGEISNHGRLMLQITIKLTIKIYILINNLKLKITAKNKMTMVGTFN